MELKNFSFSPPKITLKNPNTASNLENQSMFKNRIYFSRQNSPISLLKKSIQTSVYPLQTSYIDSSFLTDNDGPAQQKHANTSNHNSTIFDKLKRPKAEKP